MTLRAGYPGSQYFCLLVAIGLILWTLVIYKWLPQRLHTMHWQLLDQQKQKGIGWGRDRLLHNLLIKKLPQFRTPDCLLFHFTKIVKLAAMSYSIRINFLDSTQDDSRNTPVLQKQNCRHITLGSQPCSSSNADRIRVSCETQAENPGQPITVLVNLSYITILCCWQSVMLA